MKRSDKPSPDAGPVFETPEEVRDSPTLSAEEKIRILRSWAYDDAEMSVALEEGMPDAPDNDIERRVLVILEELAGDLDLEDTGPSKQHGVPSRS